MVESYEKHVRNTLRTNQSVLSPGESGAGMVESSTTVCPWWRPCCAVKKKKIGAARKSFQKEQHLVNMRTRRLAPGTVCMPIL